MIVNILVCTIDAGIERVEKILLDPRSDLKYIISHQVTDERFKKIPESLKRSDILVGQIEGRGLSRNRNNAFSMADGDIAILADDDVHYREEYINNVIKTFEAEPDLGVACLKIATPEGDPEFKDYTDHPYLLNEESSHYISTLEISYRIKLIRSRGIVFDERFGLGSELNSFGEEAVFIHDCIRAGIKVKYIPEYVVEHPAVTTIKSLDKYATLNVVFKGAYDARRYGWLAFPAAFLDYFRLRGDLKAEAKKPKDYLRERLRGACYIFFKQDKDRASKT
ncbi:MAG: glycosyltransferase [Firmicutes bacterium]|nr:glycosyltransferase [Bacillota bacterium]